MPLLMSSRGCSASWAFGVVAVLWTSTNDAFTATSVGRRHSGLDSLKASSSSSLFVDETNANVQKYYGETLESSDDLQTNACCTSGAPPDFIQDCINQIHPEVLKKYYGCGLCVPTTYDLTGCRVLDLGCGAGRDVYIASQLVGPTGKVVGVDMTREQLAVANEYKEYHTKAFGLERPNVEFVHGYLEQLADIQELKDQKFDLIISNCVINLCTDKPAVLKACYDLLEEGTGELYFSDVYANRRVPQQLQDDPVLWGECLSGALYWNDFQNMAKQAGFKDPRLVEDAPITINNAKVNQAVQQSGNGALQFYSATYRLQKLHNLEPACEDYGQAVIYKGTMKQAATAWTLDKHHVFEAGKIHPVCGNTWNMLQGNHRWKQHFQFIGNFDKHFGIFEGCGSSLPYDQVQVQTMDGKGSSSGGGGGGCC